VNESVRERLRTYLPGLVTTLFYVLLAMGQSGIYDGWSSRCYGGGRGDPGHDGWVLARVTTQLLHEPARPFDGNIYYPSRASVLYWDPLLGPAVLVLPLRALHAGPVLLYNAAIVLSLLVASLGCGRLARRLGASPLAACLAGIAVPYTSHQMARLVHLNLLAIPFFPFLLLGLVELLERPRLRAALLAGLSFALQAATSGYHAFSAVLVVLVSAAWGWRELRDRRVWLWGGAAGLLALACLYPYVDGFLWLRQHEAHMARGAQVATAGGLNLASLLVSDAYLWRRLLSGSPAFFPGLVVLVLAGRALRDLRRDKYVRLLALVALCAFALALGPQVRVGRLSLGPGPFALLQGLPLLDAMRHPHTFAIPGLMALGLLAALGFTRSSLTRSRPGALLVLAFATLEVLGPAPTRLLAPLDLPEVYGEVARLDDVLAAGGAPRGALLELPFHDRAYTWWAGFHDLTIVNGVGAFEPERYQQLWQWFRREWHAPVRDMQDSRSLEYLKTWFPVRWVVLHVEQDAAPWRALIEATPRSFVLEHTSAQGDRVYRLRRNGHGQELARGFTWEQLRQGKIEARVRGTPGAWLRAELNGVPLGAELPLGEQTLVAEWGVPSALVRRTLNMLELRVGPAGSTGVLELDDIDAR